MVQYAYGLLCQLVRGSDRGNDTVRCRNWVMDKNWVTGRNWVTVRD